MRKESYNITLAPWAYKPGDSTVKRNGMDCPLRTVTGYTFSYRGFNFGVTNRNQDGSKSSHWTVTELTSGYICGYGQTRMTAITGLTENVLEEVKKGLQKIEDSANPGLIPKVKF